MPSVCARGDNRLTWSPCLIPTVVSDNGKVPNISVGQAVDVEESAASLAIARAVSRSLGVLELSLMIRASTRS